MTIVARKRDALENRRGDRGGDRRGRDGCRRHHHRAGRSAALAACPEPDILLNNADGPLPGDFRDWSRDDWIAALDAMMLSPIEMMRLTVDGMMARGFGRIVNIVSRSVKIPQAELGLSNGARSGLVGFVAGLARQTAFRNVTINNLLPGIFDSGAQRARRRNAGFERQELRRALARVPSQSRKTLRAPGRARGLLRLSVLEHAGFITGQNLLIDGGSYPGTY